MPAKIAGGGKAIHPQGLMENAIPPAGQIVRDPRGHGQGGDGANCLEARSAHSCRSRETPGTVAPGPLRTFAKLAPLQRSFPKPATRGVVNQGLARQGQQCGTKAPFAGAARRSAALPPDRPVGRKRTVRLFSNSRFPSPVYLHLRPKPLCFVRIPTHHPVPVSHMWQGMGPIPVL